jgi:uncharacterized protein YjbI with pentapeptide repeats
MRDCNLTRARFDAGHLDGVDFRASNTNQAVFVDARAARVGEPRPGDAMPGEPRP